MRILIDQAPATLEDLANAHEDAVVAWDRDGMSELIASLPLWERDELANVRVLTSKSVPGLNRCGCPERHEILAMLFVGRGIWVEALLVRDRDSVRWVAGTPCVRRPVKPR